MSASMFEFSNYLRRKVGAAREQAIFRGGRMSLHRKRDCRHPATGFTVRATGFTVTELLIVIACLSILIGLLASAAFSAAERGRSATCLKHLRQIGMAYNLAAKSGPVPTDEWELALKPYVDDEVDVFRCPSDVEAEPTDPSYGMHKRIRRMGGGDSQKITFLGYAAREVDTFADDPGEAWQRDIRPRHLGEVNQLNFDITAHSSFPEEVDPTDCEVFEIRWRPMRDEPVLVARCDVEGVATGDASGDDDLADSDADANDGGDSDAGQATGETLCSLDSELGMSSSGDDYYRDFRTKGEKYLVGESSAAGFDDGEPWYYILPNGDLYELVPPFDRSDLVGEFVEHVGTDVYNDPSLLHDRSEGGESECD